MTRSFTLSVDLLGSETKLKDVLKGLSQSLLRNLNYKFQLYGNEILIKKHIDKYKRLLKSSEIIDCKAFISMDDKPSDILRTKESSSMYLAIKSVKEGLSDSVLSFGNTGAFMSLSLINIKTLEGIKRPAIASIWPNIKGESVVLDLGANTKLDPKYLIDNSILGASLASILFKIENPSIGLLNIGIEDNKGNEELGLSKMIDRYFEKNMDKLLNKESNNIYPSVIEKVEKSVITKILEFTKGNQLKASEILGLNRNTLRKKIGDLSIDIKLNDKN